jgi:ligand-binding sensor domain-containing protein
MRTQTTAIIILGLSHFILALDWTTYKKENSGLASNTVRAVCIDGNGVKWFGTDDGLCSFNGTEWNTYKAGVGESSLAHNYVNDIVYEESSYGPEIWVATDNGVSVVGIASLDAITFATPYRNENTDLVSNRVQTAAVDAGHIRWFGTDSGVSSFNGNVWGVYTRENFWIYHNMVMSIGTGPDSMVYIGTEGRGVSRLKMDPLDAITSASAIDWAWSGIASDSVYSIYIEPNGYQWFGTDHGVSLHTSYNTREDWLTYTTNDGLAHNFVQAICEDRRGVKWFGTKEGVSSFDGVNWTTHTNADGLAGNDVSDIAVDADGSVWFATNAGVSKLSSDTPVETMDMAPTFDDLSITSYPNPFNLQTMIQFSLPHGGYTIIDIYNLLGQKVRNLLGETLGPGSKIIQWDGRDDQGIAVKSGIYFTAITLNGYTRTCKIIVAK